MLLQTKVDRGSVCLVVRALAVSLSAPGPRLGGGREYQQTSPCPLVDDLGGQQHWFSLKPKSASSATGRLGTCGRRTLVLLF